jgi:hypothetical protein
MISNLTPRKANISMTVGIYLSLLGAFISLYFRWTILFMVFLAASLVFLFIRSLLFIFERMGKINLEKRE